MKTKGFLVLSLLVAALLVHPSTASAQFYFPAITVTNSTITNVSGITYATLNCSFPNHCYSLVSSNWGRQGTNISVNLNLFRPADIICLCDFEPMSCPGGNQVTNATVALGALAPGDYALTVYTGSYDPTFGQLYPFPIWPIQIPFTVGNPPTTPMLSLSPTNSGLVKLNVDGISGATYIIQSSPDFTNWTSIWTNHGAPFWATMTGGTNANCYFRTQILSGP